MGGELFWFNRQIRTNWLYDKMVSSKNCLGNMELECHYNDLKNGSVYWVLNMIIVTDDIFVLKIILERTCVYFMILQALVGSVSTPNTYNLKYIIHSDT